MNDCTRRAIDSHPNFLKLTAQAQSLLFRITNRLNDKNLCYMTNEQLAEIYDVTVRTIQRRRSELISQGFLTPVRSATWSVQVPQLDEICLLYTSPSPRDS